MKHYKITLIIVGILLITSKSFGQSNFKWPETPSSKVFQDFIVAYNSGLQSEIETFVKAHYSAVDNVKLGEKTEYWMDIYYRYGPVEPHSLSINKPNDLEVWLFGTISKTWFAPEFILNKDNRIKAVGMLMGMQPPNTSTPAATDEEFLSRLNSYIESNEQAGLFQGTILITQNEKVILNKGYGLKNIENKENNSTDTRIEISSVTKSITAIAILQLVQNGQLRLHKPIDQYLPNLPSTISEKITIYQLLTHTSDYKLKGIDGFKEEIEKTKSLSEVYQIHLEYLPKWERFKDFDPSEKWNYSNQGYDLLGIIIEKITGLTFEEYLRKNIFSVAGMPNTSFSDENIAIPYRYDLKHQGLKNHKDYPSFFGKVSGAAQLKSTVGDLANLFKAIKETNLLLDVAHKSLLFSPLVRRGGPDFQSLGLKISYEPVLSLGHSGVNVGNTSELKYFPNSDLLLVVLCNNRSGAPNLYNFIKNNLPNP